MADSFPRLLSILEQARELTIEAAVLASMRLSETPSAKRPQEISKLLNSRPERDVLSGMKCVIAMISRGEDGTPYFADVVKNVTLENSRVRALVMIYIQKYAENEPDTALLSINSIQKALGEKRPAARAASIRTLAGIRIPEIASLLVLCIKRTLFDLLPQVRAATAMAIGKAFNIDGINRAQLASYLATLLGDLNHVVVGAAIKVFCKLKPQLLKMLPKKAWAPIHSNFRRYTRLLSELDEWSASSLIEVLTEYTRLFVPRPQLILPDGSRLDLPDDFSQFPESSTYEADADVMLFVEALFPLAESTSEIVILAALRALLLVGAPSHVVKSGFAGVLIKMATQASNSTARLYALQIVLIVSLATPSAFQGSVKKFFLCLDDENETAKYKLQILLSLFSDASAKMIMQELQYNALSHRKEIAREAVKALGYCSQKSAVWSEAILRWCTTGLLKPSAIPVLAEMLTVVRSLLQQKQSLGSDQEQLVKTVYKLSRILQNPDLLLDADAKASIIWIIGEFTEPAKNIIGPDVLRESLKLFAYEPEKVRYELLILAAKVYLFEMLNGTISGSRLESMFRHVMNLCNYDPSLDIRDKARMLEQLLKPENHQLAVLFLQVPKNAPLVTNLSNSLQPVLSRYFEKILWADPQDLPSTSIRKEAIPTTLRYIGIDNGSAISKLPTASPKSAPFFEEARNSSSIRKANQLQSLDEFFGDDSESGELDLASDSLKSSSDLESDSLDAHSDDVASVDVHNE